MKCWKDCDTAATVCQCVQYLRALELVIQVVVQLTAAEVAERYAQHLRALVLALASRGALIQQMQAVEVVAADRW